MGNPAESAPRKVLLSFNLKDLLIDINKSVTDTLGEKAANDPDIACTMIITAQALSQAFVKSLSSLDIPSLEIPEKLIDPSLSPADSFKAGLTRGYQSVVNLLIQTDSFFDEVGHELASQLEKAVEDMQVPQDAAKQAEG